MRDLTAAEKDWVTKGLCPGCHQNSLVMGPQGGLSVNWYCNNSECGGAYNIALIPDTDNKPRVFLGEVIRESKLFIPPVPELEAGTKTELMVRKPWWHDLLYRILKAINDRLPAA